MPVIRSVSIRRCCNRGKKKKEKKKEKKSKRLGEGDHQTSNSNPILTLPLGLCVHFGHLLIKHLLPHPIHTQSLPLLVHFEDFLVPIFAIHRLPLQILTQTGTPATLKPNSFFHSSLSYLPCNPSNSTNFLFPHSVITKTLLKIL